MHVGRVRFVPKPVGGLQSGSVKMRPPRTIQLAISRGGQTVAVGGLNPPNPPGKSNPDCIRARQCLPCMRDYSTNCC